MDKSSRQEQTIVPDNTTITDLKSADDRQNGRRSFLRTAFMGSAAVGTLPLVNGTQNQVLAQAPTANNANAAATTANSTATGMIIRERDPENLESPFSTLNSFITPNERFYVRNHFGIPKIEANNWRLQVEGAVERPFEITYDELLKMPSQTVTATLESAGNNRVFLPRERGVQWELGAVGTAQWTGVPLSAVLERAGVRNEAIEVVFEGADAGEVREEPRSPGSVRFARSIPLAKARQPEVLLAYKMNGVDLPAAHGFPVRAIVPGWYGMASVKWLTRLLVSSVPFRGYFQTMDYVIWERRNGMPLLSTMGEMQVKAQIARPAMYEVVQANTPYRVFGAAWAGESDVTQVEISADDGRTWNQAALLGSPTRFAWRLWEYRWQTPSRGGRYNLMARATDSGKRVQPMQRNNDLRNYMISHVLPIAVEVREPQK
jgi:DMSO/TMAO reductase YedYZ molybdopterin-dependent catalytic subunit